MSARTPAGPTRFARVVSRSFSAFLALWVAASFALVGLAWWWQHRLPVGSPDSLAGLRVEAIDGSHVEVSFQLLEKGREVVVTEGTLEVAIVSSTGTLVAIGREDFFRATDGRIWFERAIAHAVPVGGGPLQATVSLRRKGAPDLRETARCEVPQHGH